MFASSSSDYISVAKEFGKFIADIYVHPVIFFTLVFILVALFTIRFFMIMTNNRDKASKMGMLKKYRIYLISHTFAQFLICLLISYVVIKVTYAMFDSYIINWVVSPIIGLFGSLILDSKLVTPIEEKTGNFVNPLTPSQNSKKVKKENKSEAMNNITINVGHNIANDKITKEENAKEECKKMSETIEIKQTDEAMIKSIIDVQEAQDRKLQEMAVLLDAMRENTVTNMRFELHDAMMECIVREYATIQEFDRISAKMANYKALGGNHGVDLLYETKFKVLQLRED